MTREEHEAGLRRKEPLKPRHFIIPAAAIAEMSVFLCLYLFL